MKVITVSNYKGGCAKTTTAVNLAYDLAAEESKRVLLIDADPQGNASYILWRYNPNANTLCKLYDGRPLKSLIRRSKYKGLDIVPAITELEKVNQVSGGLNPNELRRQIDGISDRYDYVVIDCQPTMQFLTISALYAADLVIVPFKAAGFNINGLELMQDYLENAAKKREYAEGLSYACLLTMFNGRTKSLNRVMDLIEQDSYTIFDTMISFSAICESAEDKKVRKPLLKHRRNSKVAADYLELTKEVLQEIGE
ncbi:MAG: ParA family protein [Lachnospiraceae bacterium]|nr:ParA family protein [Lachnospiraceae bacterium]MDE7203201.1 ParA family protein [Lachnospiraceae bacterium]